MLRFCAYAEYAGQLAKSIGAEVTVVDSGDKLDMLRAIGADHVIDYTREDFTKRGEIYDAIIDNIHYLTMPKAFLRKGFLTE